MSLCNLVLVFFFYLWIDIQAVLTEPQNVWDWKGPLEVIWSTTQLKQGHLEQVAQGHVQMAFESLQGWRSHNLSGPVPVLSYPHTDKMFLDVQREPHVFQFVPIACGPVTEHHWKVPISVLFAPFLWIWDSPWGFSRLISPSSLSFPSCVRCSFFQVHLVCCWSLIPESDPYCVRVVLVEGLQVTSVVFHFNSVYLEELTQTAQMYDFDTLNIKLPPA